MRIDIKRKISDSLATDLSNIAPTVPWATHASHVIIDRAVGKLTHPRTKESFTPFYLLIYYQETQHLGTMRVIFHPDGRHELFAKPARILS